MAYRLREHRHHEPRRTAVDIATPIKLYVHNGTVANFAFPCWYQEIHPPIPANLHDRKLHDHHGWPNPSHPDHICQLWIPEQGHCIHGMQECHPHCRHYIDYKRVFPIHLTSEYEGYDSADVAWVDKPDGISAEAYIDPVEDWVVRLHVECMDPNALEEPQHYKLTVFVNSPGESTSAKSVWHPSTSRRDIVALAELVVLPSAYGTDIGDFV